MKKVLFSLMLVLMLVGMSGCFQDEEDIVDENNVINIPISTKKVLEKSTDIYEITESFGEQQKNLVEKNILKYDNLENLIENTYYDINGNITRMYKWKYDENNNEIELAFYNSDGSLDHKYTYTYDERNNKIQETEYDENGDIEEQTKWKYDENNKTIEEELVISSYSWEDPYIAIYLYDDNDNKIQSTTYDINGNITRMYKSKYDENNNKIEWAVYNADGTLDYKYIYTYDENNNKIEEIEYDENENEVERITSITIERENYYSYTDYKEDGTIDWLHSWEYFPESKTLEVVTIYNWLYSSSNTKEIIKFNEYNLEYYVEEYEGEEKFGELVYTLVEIRESEFIYNETSNSIKRNINSNDNEDSLKLLFDKKLKEIKKDMQIQKELLLKQ